MLTPRLECILVFSSNGGGVQRGLGDALSSVTGLFSEPVLRLGVTGLSRAGKTVFITSLVANLLDRGRMPQLKAARAGRILAVHLQPQPDMTLPRFAYEDHLAALTGDTPRWPQSTRAVSELRLSFLLDKTYAEWSEGVLEKLAKERSAADYLAVARAEDGAQKFDEGRAQALAECYTAWMIKARAGGWADCTPGRFLLPGDLAGSPVLTFAPLPTPATLPRGCLAREMQRRYDAYVARVVKPFFRDHFAKLDRQIVLADVLGAIHQGPRALEDLRQTMTDVLRAFRPGRNGWLSAILGGKRVEKILFAATKADHLHQNQHKSLTDITEALLREARARADFAGAETSALALASFRATVEEKIERGGETLYAVRGRLEATGKQAVMYPGELPSDPARLLSPAREGAEAWLGADYGVMSFAPARITRRPGEGPPHIRLDRAAEFLLGDRL
jgi:predicted YcjX-like family ATPase